MYLLDEDIIAAGFGVACLLKPHDDGAHKAWRYQMLESLNLNLHTELHSHCQS